MKALRIALLVLEVGVLILGMIALLGALSGWVWGVGP